MHCALFQEFIENIFKFSANLDVRNKVLWKVASFCDKDLKPIFFFLLSQVQREEFYYDRQYLVNLTCNCWFRMCTQFHQKLVNYKCMLFVDCLMVLREYFVNWNKSDEVKYFFFFLDLIVNYLDKIRSFWFVFVRLI